MTDMFWNCVAFPIMVMGFFAAMYGVFWVFLTEGKDRE
jgi:hypothetical protein